MTLSRIIAMACSQQTSLNFSLPPKLILQSPVRHHLLQSLSTVHSSLTSTSFTNHLLSEMISQLVAQQVALLTAQHNEFLTSTIRLCQNVIHLLQIVNGRNNPLDELHILTAL
jgi:hypothetical protein